MTVLAEPVLLRCATGSFTAAALRAEVSSLAQRLRDDGVRVLASALDNGAAWVVADLAASDAGIVHVPLPLFFTATQHRHAMRSTGADMLLATPAFAWDARARPHADTVAGEPVAWWRLDPAERPAYHDGTAKVTFTSGTTGTPKGVCLRGDAMQAVAQGLVQALAPLGIERHLCALPLAVLLENVAGLLAPLSHGACCSVLPLAALGLTGSSGFDPARFAATVEAERPHSLILLPQMLRAWAAWLHHAGRRAPASLKFVAVGGAAVGARNLAAARAVGIPAYEGYGLSEGASVQTLNLPGADRPGSAGRVLPHARVRVADDGELWIAGSLFAGYVGERGAPRDWWPTGDLGDVDTDGFVHVRGRRRHVLITGFGRNVSPEWVETALRETPAIAQAAVFGDGEPALDAVLWPASPALPDAALQAAVDAANATLPDYARVRRWVRALAPLDAASGLATANGRPRREAVWRLHAPALAASAPRFLDPAALARQPATMTTTPFHRRLLADTADARQGLLESPIVQGCLRGEVSLPSYLAFLAEAYHHVRHTVPLLRACRDALPPHLAWLRAPLDEYVDEEAGHDEWILDDIRACGGDAEAVRHGRPALATEVMVAYAYDTIARGHPLGFLGMVHVLEGTSVSLALLAADAIQRPLGLPDRAFGYLRSHGTLDREHTAHFAALVDRIDDPRDQDAIVHGARVFYRLYGDVFRSLPRPAPAAAASSATAEALA
jgi:long-subunit acyl-CoA synthetase (AMP-forming)/pyrroloquinoline quinone (PQQ) biosynthesis protein C